MASAHQSGETMASTRTRLDPTALQLVADLVYTDIWADVSKTGVTARTSIALRYTGNAMPANDLATAVPTNGIINYPDHIQPLWTRSRGTGGANTCTTCHNDPDKLDLRAGIGGSGRMTSYDELMLGDPVIDPVTGLPKTRIEEGVLVIARGPALVDTAASEGEALGLARKSRLVEILSGENLMAGSAARTAHPNPPASAPDHSTMLNAAEKRLVAEWIDLGGKYYNDPFDAASGVRTLNGLSQATFEAQVFPILQIDLRRGLPPGDRQQHLGGAGRHLVPQQPLRAHRRCRRRLQRDADDDLERLQRGLELPAEQALDRAAPARRARPDDGRAAGGQRELHHDRQLDRREAVDEWRMLTMDTPRAPPRAA